MSTFNKRIFISYSHDNPEHQARVRQLADSLRTYGLDCRLDQYESRDPSEGWPLWMEAQIELAHVVLLICTETYLRRVQGKETPGVGRGVCWEANLIYADLYESQNRNTKFYPVIFHTKDKSFIPKPLGTHHVFYVSDSVSFQELYAFLTGQHRHAPEIGAGHRIELPKPLPPFELPGRLAELEYEETADLSADLLGPLLEAPLKQRQLRTNKVPESRVELRELDWYDEADAACFRGRDNDVKRLRRLLLDGPIVRLFGPSGVGKSSLLRAGLLPELKRHGWRAVVVRPWDNPELHIPRLISEQLFENGATSLQNNLALAAWQRALMPSLGACPRKKLLKNNALEIRTADFKISRFPETRILTGDWHFSIFLENS